MEYILYRHLNIPNFYIVLSTAHRSTHAMYCTYCTLHHWTPHCPLQNNQNIPYLVDVWSVTASFEDLLTASFGHGKREVISYASFGHGRIEARSILVYSIKIDSGCVLEEEDQYTK